MPHISELKVYILKSSEFHEKILEETHFFYTECYSPLYIIDKGLLYCLSYLDEVDILSKFDFDVELITHFRLLDIRKNLYYGNINILYRIIEDTYLEASPDIISVYLYKYFGYLYDTIASILYYKKSGNLELRYEYSVLAYTPDNITYMLQYNIGDVHISLYKDEMYMVNFKCDLDMYTLMSKIPKYYIKITPIISS